jgi:hypothetical protein
MAIGMSVPGYTGNWSPAGQALFGGSSPADQIIPGETEEARKKRLQALQAAQATIGARLGAGFGSALGSYSPSYSPAGIALGFGK